MPMVRSEGGRIYWSFKRLSQRTGEKVPIRPKGAFCDWFQSQSRCSKREGNPSALERGHHDLYEGAAAEIGSADRCARWQIVAEEFDPGRVHFLLLREIGDKDRSADHAGGVRSGLFQVA